MKLSIDQIKDLSWEELGRHFGYPECCIDWFVNVRIRNVYRGFTQQQESVHGYNGFIPCPACAEKVTKDTIHTLIKNRVCETPYPNDGL